MNKWHARFISLAESISTWSKDPSTKVGSVIVDKHNRIVSLGFNGPPRGTEDSITSREIKLLRTIHAEENAMLFAQRDLTGCSIYVTHHPCAACAAKIIQSGISNVYFSELLSDHWTSNAIEASELFAESGVTFERIMQ